MRVCFLAFLGIVVFNNNVVFAQASKMKRFTTPLAGSVVLKDVEDKYNVSVTGLRITEPDADAEQKKLQEIKKEINLKYPRKSSGLKKKTSSSVLPPTVAIGWVADSLPGIPPDNYLAVSNGQKAITVMNELVAVHDATTGAYLYHKNLNYFSASVGLGSTGYPNQNYRFDPKVVYDPEADRFICVLLNGTNHYNYIVLGFSQSNDPAGTWKFYKMYGDYTGDTTWFDYPAISVTHNEFFLTGNKIKFDSSWQAGFTRSLIYQVRKQDGYNGDSLLTYQIWDSVQYNNKFLRCLYPLNPGNTLLGPDQYFLSNRNFDISNDSIFIVKVPDTIGSADTTLTVTAVKATTGAYGVPPDARQPDTALTLATNDGRVLGGFIKDNEIQFVSTSLNPANGAAAIFHGTISNFNTTPAFTGQLITNDTLDFGYPNISFAGSLGTSNHSIISYEYSGPHKKPGFGAVLFDGTNYSDMLIIRAGDSTINMQGPGQQRWGDYSGSHPDWTTTGSVWVEGIFGKKNLQYGNYAAKLVSPYRVGVNTPKAAPVAANLYPNPSFEFVSFDFTVQNEQAFSFIIYDMQGRMVDKLTDNFCNEGRNIIRFNIAPLASGTYFLKAIGSKGEQIEIQKFIKK